MADHFPFQDPDLPVEERVRDLVSRMSVEEKISQLVYEAAAIPRLGIPEYNWWNECLHGVGRSGVATVFPQAIGLAAAVLAAWYPGQAGGTAVADILFGGVSPSGRLPVTFVRSVEQLPPFTDYAMTGRTYRFMDGEPLYPFGCGLSYTSFAYAGL